MMQGIYRFLILLALPAVVLAGSPTELRSIGLTPTEGGARVSLETTAVTPHSFFTLDNPYRVVIDLRNTRLAPGVRAPEGVGAVETIRTGVRPGGALRVVIEMKSQMPARA
jgi:N-acetylmuramoyl-L-alanine amidase